MDFGFYTSVLQVVLKSLYVPANYIASVNSYPTDSHCCGNANSLQLFGTATTSKKLHL